MRFWRMCNLKVKLILDQVFKMKATMFNNDLCEHLSVANFYVKNIQTNNYCEFYK